MHAIRRLTAGALVGAAVLVTAACNQDDTAAPATSNAAAHTSVSSVATDTCATSALSLTLDPKPTADQSGQHHLNLVLTNTGSDPCRMQGFPGVQLGGPDDMTYGPTYDLPRAGSEAPAAVTLGPGGKAVSEVVYLEGPANGWVPEHILVTPPDQTTSLRADWKLPGSVLRQDGATHPGTFVKPLRPGS